MSTEMEIIAEKSQSMIVWDTNKQKSGCSNWYTVDDLSLKYATDDNGIKFYSNDIESTKINANESSRYYYFELIIDKCDLQDPGNVTVGINLVDLDFGKFHRNGLFTYETSSGLLQYKKKFFSCARTEIMHGATIGFGFDFHLKTIFFASNGNYLGAMEALEAKEAIRAIETKEADESKEAKEAKGVKDVKMLNDMIKNFTLYVKLEKKGMGVHLNTGQTDFDFNFEEYFRPLASIPDKKIHAAKITAVAITNDGNFIASFSEIDNIIALWCRPTESNSPVTLGLNHLKNSSKIDADNIQYDDLTISQKQLPYDEQQNGLFIILFCRNGVEKVKPMVLYEDMKPLFPACLKDMKGRAEFLDDCKTLVIFDDFVINVVSVTSWPWTLVHQISLSEKKVASFTFHPLTNKCCVILTCKVSFNIIDIYTGHCCTRGYAPFIIDDKKVCISSSGNLLAFSNGSILELQTGITIIENNNQADKAVAFQFTNNDQHILRIEVKKTGTIATLSDVYSNVDLVSTILPQGELAHMRHVKFINYNRIVSVFQRTYLPGQNVLVFEEWYWEDAFHAKPENHLDSVGYEQIKRLKMTDNNHWWSIFGSFNYFKIIKYSGNNLKEDSLRRHYRKHNGALIWPGSPNFICLYTAKMVSRIDDKCAIIVFPHGIFLLWREQEEVLRCLVWMLPEQSSQKIQKVSYQYMENLSGLSNARVLKFNITCEGNNEFHSLLPLDITINGQGLPTDWMQGSYNYLIQEEKHRLVEETISQYTKYKKYKTIDIDGLIQINANNILSEILKNDSYLPIIANGKNPLIKAIEQFKPSLIQILLKYCLRQCLRKHNPGYMMIITNAVPQLSIQYPNILSSFVKQCTYFQLPLQIVGGDKKYLEYYSTNEKHWGSALDGSVFPDTSKMYQAVRAIDNYLDSWIKIPKHPATFCYVPIPGLCTYPTVNKRPQRFFDFLFPHSLSPFAKLAFRYSFGSFKHHSFEAIVKFKWHTYARLRFFVLLFIYFIHFGIFVAAVSDSTIDIATDNILIAISMTFGTILTILWIRRAIIRMMHSLNFFKSFSTYIELAAYVLPVITGFHEWGTSSATPQLRSLSILFLWIFIAAQLRAFKGVGIFIAVINDITIKIGWLLFFLAMILFAFAHFLLVLISSYGDGEQDNAFLTLDQSLKNVWSMLLSDYSSIDPWDNDRLVNIFKIAFSFSTTIVLLNLLIALMNNTYEESYKYAHTAWVVQRAELIADIEVSWMFPSERQNWDYFPWTIMYEAFSEEVERWAKKKKELNADLDDDIQTLDEIADKMEDKMDDMKTEITKMKDEMIKKLTDEMNKKLTDEVSNKLTDELSKTLMDKMNNKLTSELKELREFFSQKITVKKSEEVTDQEDTIIEVDES